MPKNFTWERGPFEKCPQCGKQTFGFLSAGGNSMILRCSECRYSRGEVLPKVNKATIYLDQFVFSAIFKIKAGGQAPVGQQNFYDELIPLLRRIVLLQQAILPHSDFHSNETIVFHDARGLREAYEAIGGDASFHDHRSIEHSQIFAFATAFRDGKEPALVLEPDEILNDSRNAWLSDMRISANMDYSQFASGIRRQRDRGFDDLKKIVELWAQEKPSFQEQLRRELEIGKHRRAALANLLTRAAMAAGNADGMALLNVTMEPLWHEYVLLCDVLSKNSPEEDKMRRVGEFWDWDKLKETPYNKIFAYLFAAFSRRIGMGQRKFTRGLMTDFQAISTYAPYVDAMFVDRECAVLLSEGDLRKNLYYRAAIYSYATADAFLDYLYGLEAQATEEVRGFARRIYGLE